MFTASSVYGAQAQIPAAGVAAVTEPMGISHDNKSFGASLVDPHNPLMWFGLFMLGTVGAAGLSGSARLGKAKVAASLGST